jgi:serine/threonine-protein kinase
MEFAADGRIGPYEIVAPIGAGGMGEVYRARDTRLGRDVAVKMLSERLAGSADSLARFEQEARAVAALSSPNVVALYDVGMENGRAYAVMELLEGESLDRLLGREAVTWRRAVEIGAAVADGLSAAHAKAIVHRDLKPANVFITTDGSVKILDFGLAAPAAFPSDASTRAAMLGVETEPGVILGTAGYMSPEQVKGAPADARSDIFSLGCILYEMLAARRAFRGDTAAETLASILRDQPADLSDLGRAVPPAVETVLRRCLEKNPEHRFQSSRDLAFALRALLTGSMDRADGRRPPHALVRSRPVAGVAALVVVVISLLALDAGGLRSSLTGPQARRVGSLAVLPLVNQSSDPDQEYLADGITDQLIGDLGRIEGLRVTSRTSVMTYKGVRKPLPEIARELGVDAVVEGSVVRDGSRVRISARVIEAATDAPVWSHSFERDIGDILVLQKEIAEQIARKIAVELTPTDRAWLQGGRRVDPKAFEAYVRGRYYWNKRSQADLERALQEFRRSIDADPAYATAYAGLADSYALLGYQNHMAPLDAFPKARAAALRARELDDSLAEPHAALGYIGLYFDWNFADAEAAFKRAIALDADSATARHYYSILLTALLRPVEAREQIERARNLDPLSVLIASDMGFELYYDRQYDKATAALKEAIATNPGAALPHFWLGRVYQAQGRYDDAESEYRAAGSGVSAWPPGLSGLGHMQAIAGQRAEAENVLRQLDEMAKRSYVSPYAHALVYLGLGDRTQTYRWLEQSLEERANWMVWLLKDPRWDPLRGDPRFESIVQRVGFPPDARARAPRPVT